MDPLSLSIGLAQFAPSIIKLLTGSDKAGAVADSVVEIAKTVTGNDQGVEALKTIQADPAKAMEFRAAIAAQEQALQRIAADAAQSVNETMRTEAESEHWPTYSWRPAIGFAVALAVLLSVLTVFFAYGAVIFYNRSEGLQHLPGILAAIAGIIGVVSPILGIASWFRGRMQSDPSIPTINKG